MSIGELLGENENPLTPEEREQMQQMVVSTARRYLVARRFIDLFGPLGVGVQSVPLAGFKGMGACEVDFTGDAEAERITTAAREFRTLPILYKEFLLHWRDIQAARDHNLPLDLSPASIAAAWCAQKEDELVFHGNQQLGIEGLLNAKGRLVQGIGSWDGPGSAFTEVVAAVERLNSEGFLAPFALVTSPRRYASLHRVHERTGVLEVESLRALLGGGVFQSNQLRPDSALVVALGPQNLDLAIGLDLSVAYLSAEKMNHPFRVLEVVMPRIKQPRAICTLEPQG
jgi:uncharacterized linocin/CFP29 family protein